MHRSLGNTTSADAFFWADVTGPGEKELVELSRQFQIHPTSLKDCLDPLHLPKFETIGETRFLLLRYADTQAAKQADADTVRELTRKIAIFLLPNGIITIHRATADFIDEIWPSWEKEPPRDRDQLFHIVNQIIKRVVMTYEPMLLAAEDVFEEFEDRILSRRPDEKLLEQLYFLKRKVTVYKKMLRASLDAVSRCDSPTLRNGPYFQDLKEEWERQYFHAEELVEDSNHLMQTQLSLASYRTNEVMRILTLFSAFFLPLTFIVGIYGMNFVFLPELKWKYGYPATLIGMALITLGIWTWFRRNRWL